MAMVQSPMDTVRSGSGSVADGDIPDVQSVITASTVMTPMAMGANVRNNSEYALAVAKSEGGSQIFGAVEDFDFGEEMPEGN